MTNQELFIKIFGIDAWQQMIVFSGLAEKFKEYWTSPWSFNSVSVINDIRKEIDMLEGSEMNSPTSVTVFSWEYMKKQVFKIIDKHIGKEGLNGNSSGNV